VQRNIELPGCNNFRDLGGYPTADGGQLRWRTLFRSDALHELSPEGVRRFVAELKIGTIVDLRSTGELGSDGRGALAEESPDYHHLPLFDGAISEGREAASELTLADRYFLMAEYAKAPIARVVEALARSGAPAVYHCAAGKDRTGVVSAILLGLLGVRDEIIIADYAASQDNLEAIVERLMASEGYREMLENLPVDTLHANPETMVSLLDRLRENYGSVRGYAREIGLSDDTIAALARSMLETS
jgi:protein-tyrosine phosphatase